MWRLIAYPMVFVVIWWICQYPHKFFGAIDRIDAKFKEWAYWILK